MNAVEIEEAISALAEQPFDSSEFPYLFLQSFGNKETTLKRLRSGGLNKSDLGGVLQTNNIHIVVCMEGDVSKTLVGISASIATKKGKVKFGLATDGKTFEAEDYNSGETVVCDYSDFPDHFGFFLPLAGISTVKQIRDNAFDIKATSRLNRLYVQLLSENPDWTLADRREEMNHFMARLIFCFFAEDTNIFRDSNLFTRTIEQMSQGNVDKTHEVISEIFRSMNTKIAQRKEANISRWADSFPYVNGGLFAGDVACPRFSKIARSYLLHIGNLDWTKINPDIFGSMIQAIADDEERGDLGMHYTSVPNILKVLNPLFLDQLRGALAACGTNQRKLLNLKKRIFRIRVFDPACGSGNFLVIAYRELRAIENEINKRRGESGKKTEIPITNFRGIELRNFSAEIARLALIIAEYQCDVTYLGQKEALTEFLPLSTENWITCANALRIDWRGICPPKGNNVYSLGEDLFDCYLPSQSDIDFDNEGGETYICTNPPYKGRNKKKDVEKADTEVTFERYKGSYASVDYVGNWIVKAAEYCKQTGSEAGIVATNSVCQGEQVALLWPVIFSQNIELVFAHTSFEWSNLAASKAGVTVVIVGISPNRKHRQIFTGDEARLVDSIGPYLIPNNQTVVEKSEFPISNLPLMYLGNMAKDGSNLIMSPDRAKELVEIEHVNPKFLKKFYGSEELIHATPRACLWIEDESVPEALQNKAIEQILAKVRNFRLRDDAAVSTQKFANLPHRFVQISAKNGEFAIVIPRVSSVNRAYLPVDYLKAGAVIGDKCFAIFDEPLWNFALISSKMHVVWIGAVCSRLRNDYSYGNKLGWNTFPVPPLTQKNKDDLVRCAENILLARESHFPMTIANLYGSEGMPENLREAHIQNDEILERIYIGRKFKNDTERLEKLFELYTKMTNRSKARLS